MINSNILKTSLALGLLASPHAQAQSAKDVLDLILRAQPNAQPKAPRLPSGRSSVPRNDDVAEMQRLLNMAGYGVGTPDGVAGPATSAGIIAFQTSQGFQPTGELTSDQLSVLRALVRAGQPAAPAKPTVDVAAVQQGLTDLGYEPGPVDGQWGQRSQRALDSFRVDQGVGRTGRPEAADLSDLLAATAPLSAAATEVAMGWGTFDLKTLGRGGTSLASLPVVERGMTFHTSWTGDSTPGSMLAIVPTDAGTVPGMRVWPIGSTDLVALEAPEDQGKYDLIWLEAGVGEILVRRPIEVR